MAVHLHGAAFTSWILLLIVQTLVSVVRVDVHRRLGLAGFGLACVMVVLGALADADLLLRGAAGGLGVNAKAFYAGTFGDMAIFGTLTFLRSLRDSVQQPISV